MGEKPELSRRDLLKLAAATAMTMLVRAQLPAVAALQRAQQALPVRLAALLAHPESAKVIGNEYLRNYPQEADRDILLSRITSRLDLDNIELFATIDDSLREKLDGMIRADFAADQVVKLRGWILSVTEARLCALAALS